MMNGMSLSGKHRKFAIYSHHMTSPGNERTMLHSRKPLCVYVPAGQ